MPGEERTVLSRRLLPAFPFAAAEKRRRYYNPVIIESLYEKHMQNDIDTAGKSVL